MTGTFISVVIATYNTARYLPETLESAIAQTHPDREIIVVDDGSTDDTAERVGPYLSRIRYIPQEHGGLASARNAGLKVARGDFIALLDADDLWRPEKLAVQLQVAARHPESGLIACDGVEFEDKTVIHPRLFGRVADAFYGPGESEITGNFYREFLKMNQIHCPSQILITRRVLEEVGPFGDFGAQDYDYYLRVAIQFPMTFHRDSLVGWRYRAESMSGPRERRNLAWKLQSLPVLQAHAHRCDAADRALVDHRIDELVHSAAQDAFYYGAVTNRAHAIEILSGLLRARPGSPVVLSYLGALGVASA